MAFLEFPKEVFVSYDEQDQPDMPDDDRVLLCDRTAEAHADVMGNRVGVYRLVGEVKATRVTKTIITKTKGKK